MEANMTLRITTLAEDTVNRGGLLAEHGLAFWIELGGRRFLFDAGQGLALVGNARRLGIRLERAGAVVVSHGHYDHTGGLAAVLRLPGERRVYAHPAALLPKYARNDDGSARAIGIPREGEKAIRERAELVLTGEPAELGAGLLLTGPVPRRTDYEDVGGPYFTDAVCLQSDALPDDQAVFVEMPGGTVVILGCAHAGVINTLNYIRELTGGRPIQAVVGGMHLLHAGPVRLERTLSELRRLDPKRLWPCHCTGFSAAARIWQAFPDRCAPCPVGTVLEWKNKSSRSAHGRA